jgi:hypothetical protein
MRPPRRATTRDHARVARPGDGDRLIRWSSIGFKISSCRGYVVVLVGRYFTIGPYCLIVLGSLRSGQRHEQSLTFRTELALGRQCGRSVAYCSLVLERRTGRLTFRGRGVLPWRPQVADWGGKPV